MCLIALSADLMHNYMIEDLAMIMILEWTSLCGTIVDLSPCPLASKRSI